MYLFHKTYISISRCTPNYLKHLRLRDGDLTALKSTVDTASRPTNFCLCLCVGILKPLTKISFHMTFITIKNTSVLVGVYTSLSSYVLVIILSVLSKDYTEGFLKYHTEINNT